MSRAAHTGLEQPKSEHGTVASYVTGFILSLICTVIPYYLVVNKTVSGDLLLATILGFAIVQMAIQILFFLHLGRGPKPLYNVSFFAATLGIILIVVGGSIYIMNHLHYNMTPIDLSKQLAETEAIYQVEGNKTGACQQIKANHQITITSGQPSPLHTDAQLCDTLTFINEDTAALEIVFGTPPNYDTYAGETELTVRKGGSQIITLNQSGSYQFHDNLHPEISGDFNVAP